MDKFIFFIVPLLLSTQPAFAQVVYSFGSTGAEYGKASTVDTDSNYICAALFSQTVNVNPAGTTTLSSRGNIDVALVKLNKRGGLVLARRFGGAATTDAPHAVGTDSVNNIYVAGYFGLGGNPTPQSADFNPNGGGTLITKSGFDAYLAKYDKNGNYLWALALGNTLSNTEERAWDIAVDKGGSVYLSGGFYGSVDFNPLGQPRVVTLPNSNAGLFLAKYNSSGINEWVVPVAANDTSIFFEAYTTVCLDGAGNAVFAGNFRGSNVNFNPAGSELLSSAGQTDIFFASYTTAGSFNWAKRVGGTLQDIVSPGAMRADRNNNIFFTGRIAGTVDFDPGTGTNNVTGASLFLASYSSSGLLRFAFGMPSNPGDGGHRVAFDREQNVYVAGWMNGTVNFNPTGTANLTANSTTADVFLAKYSNTGVYYWARNFGAANATDQNIAAGLSVDQEDNVYITGQFSGTNADFDPGTGQLLLNSIGGNDCFIAKYTKEGSAWLLPTGTAEPVTTPDAYELQQNYPNPFNPGTIIEFSLGKQDYVTIKLFDILGNELKTLTEGNFSAGSHRLSFNAEGLASGIYFYTMRCKGFMEVKKMAVTK